MDRVKSSFSIKNLEHLSGIKAHTIRIWEKRYSLFQPERTDTNIRMYNLENLQKLLNVSLLYNNGFKISKIAKLEMDEINHLVHNITLRKSPYDWSLGLFKLAMINFDQQLFTKTFDELMEKLTFSEIFQSIFNPLMVELGVLWQTNSISPSHEHFITSLIKQKIHFLSDKIQNRPALKKDKVFILFLPNNEIHELGLLFLNYEILNHGYKTIFLGQSVPTESLSNLLDQDGNLFFVSCFTIEPNRDLIHDYLDHFTENILKKDGSELWITGIQTQFVETKKYPRIKTFSTIYDLSNHLA
ncbi:MAG: MerR family transcriptional regulator [Flavobacteriaceae bacterium]|nr:MerR family transcriptional regulator [Flavobacteriaceae bacterium]